MESKKKSSIIFIDGNNFYHNLKYMKMNPSHIDFSKLINSICSYFNVNQAQKPRYYNSVPNIEDNQEVYLNHIRFFEELRKMNIEVISRKLQRSSTQEILHEKNEIISNLGLCDKCKPLVEINCKDCIGSIKRREKGIDVKIAIDIVESAIKDRCDCIILVSGDADFIPALKLAEEHKITVYSAFLRVGYSYELRNNFKFLIMNNDFIINCFKDR